MLVCNKCGAAVGKCECISLGPIPQPGTVIEMQPEESDLAEALEAEGLSPAVRDYLARLVGTEAARVGIGKPPTLPEMGGGALPTRHLCVGCGEYLATLVSLEETGPWVSLCKKCFGELKAASAGSREARLPPPLYPAPGGMSDAALRSIVGQSAAPAPASSPARASAYDESGGDDLLADPEILKLAKEGGIDVRTLRKLANMSEEELERVLTNGGR